MTSQLRRSAVSIPANIAEGAGRGTQREFARYLRMAAGSASELETHFIICEAVGLLDSDDASTAERSVAAIKGKLHRLESTLT